jgi:hypothetical protein
MCSSPTVVCEDVDDVDVVTADGISLASISNYV